MGLPVLSLGLFLVFPWQEVLALYLALSGVSLFFDWLMMDSMRLPVSGGCAGMIGSMAKVLTWGKRFRAGDLEGRDLASENRMPNFPDSRTKGRNQ